MPTSSPPSAAAAESAGRVLPQAEAAERALLGACLLNPAEAARVVTDAVPVAAFYHERHRLVYLAILDLLKTGKAVDPVVLAQHLTDRGQLEEVGGPSFLVDLCNAIPTLTNLDDYIGLVRDKYTRRCLIGALDHSLVRAYDGQDEQLTDLLDHVEEHVLAATQTAAAGPAVADLADAAGQWLQELSVRVSAEANGITGIPTGFGTLDRFMCGLHSEYIIVAARPGIGKTSLGLNIARHVAATQGQPVGFFSVEMPKSELIERLYSDAANVPAKALRSGQLDGAAAARIVAAHRQLADVPLYIDDTGGLDVVELRRRARFLIHKHGCKLIVVDHFHCLTTAIKRAQNDETSYYTAVSTKLREAQKELGVPFLVLAQLNRDVEKRERKSAAAKIKLSDLRSSGTMEQDAHTVIGIERLTDDDQGAEDTGKVTLRILKQRHGPLGTVALRFDGNYCRFENISQME